MLLPFFIPTKSFCERNLVANDPYQFEHLSVTQLVNYWFHLKEHRQMPSKELVNEIRKRLSDGGVSDQSKEILTKLTGVRVENHE